MQGKNKAEEVDIRKSIHENIRLILKTFSLTYRFDPTFGCVMNKYHASTPPQKQLERVWRQSMRDAIRKNLKDMLQRYETRIKVNDVMIDLQASRKRNSDAIVKVKVQISGQLTLGRNENFHYPDSEIAEAAQELFPLMIPVGKG